MKENTETKEGRRGDSRRGSAVLIIFYPKTAPSLRRAILLICKGGSEKWGGKEEGEAAAPLFFAPRLSRSTNIYIYIISHRSRSRIVSRYRDIIEKGESKLVERNKKVEGILRFYPRLVLIREKQRAAAEGMKCSS